MKTKRHTAGRFFLASLASAAMLVSPILVSPALAELIADAGGPYTGLVGENVQLRGTAFTDGGRVVQYRWIFGDGNSNSGSSATVNHKYLSAGEYLVELAVVDIDGFISDPVTTTATIVDPTTTTTTTPTSTTTSPTATTSTTTTSPTSTTTTTTTSPTSTTTTTTTTSPTSTTRSTSPKTSATSTTSPTAAPSTATTVEVGNPAEGLSVTAFSLVPPIVLAGGEIALTVVFAADIPGNVDIQFRLDGQPLGDPATVNAGDESAGRSAEAVFTRTLPSGMESGSHRVELVTTRQPPQVLASRTIEVVTDSPSARKALTPAPPTPAPSTRPGLIVAIAVGGAAAVSGAGFRVATWHRGRATIRRLGRKRR